MELKTYLFEERGPKNTLDGLRLATTWHALQEDGQPPPSETP